MEFRLRPLDFMVFFAKQQSSGSYQCKQCALLGLWLTA